MIGTPPPTLASKPTARPRSPGLAKNLAAMLCEQSLVRGNDVLARRQSLHDQRAGRLVAAKQFDHDIDIGTRDNRRGVARNQFRRHAKRGDRA